MLEKLVFETNKPVELALAYDGPKEVDGKFGKQFFYTTTDNRCFYMPLNVGQIVNEQLAAQQIKARERFDLVRAEIRDKGKMQIRWQVKRIDPVGPQPDGTFVVPACNGAEAAAGTATPVAKQSDNGNGNTTPPPTPALPVLPPDRPKTKLEDALKTVVAACHAARNYAKEIGYEAMPPFTSEDIRTMANTLMIQNGNGNGHTNGGAR
jgi:hypothetical protein